jgi:hypothetical protein
MLRLVDNRNADPAIFRKARIAPQRAISVGFEVKIPDVDDLEPTPVAEGFVPRQAFNFVVFREKASLESVLLPIARAKQADLYLPTGEISDTLLHRIARDADEDGRPLVVFTVSDCDPAGYQMPISIARKLKAFRGASRNSREETSPLITQTKCPSLRLTTKQRRASQFQSMEANMANGRQKSKIRRRVKDELKTAATSSKAETPIQKPGKFDLNKFKSKRGATIANVETLQGALPHCSIAEANDFVRLHPDEENYWSAELCFVKVPIPGTKRDMLHLIDEDIAIKYLSSKKILRFSLALASKPHDVFFLCQVPTQNLDNSWNASNLQACEISKTAWVQVTSRKAEGVESLTRSPTCPHS